MTNAVAAPNTNDRTKEGSTMTATLIARFVVRPLDNLDAVLGRGEVHTFDTSLGGCDELSPIAWNACCRSAARHADERAVMSVDTIHGYRVEYTERTKLADRPKAEPAADPGRTLASLLLNGASADDASVDAAAAKLERAAKLEADRKRRQRNAARRMRDQVARDLGLVKVRGALGGTYYE